MRRGVGRYPMAETVSTEPLSLVPKKRQFTINIILVNAEHYGRAGANPRVYMGMRSIATYVLSPSFKKTQPYLVIYMYNIP